MWTLIDTATGTILGYAEAVAEVLDHPGLSVLIGDLLVAPGALSQNEAIAKASEVREDVLSLDDSITQRDKQG